MGNENQPALPVRDAFAAVAQRSYLGWVCSRPMLQWAQLLWWGLKFSRTEGGELQADQQHRRDELESRRYVIRKLVPHVGMASPVVRGLQEQRARLLLQQQALRAWQRRA